MTLRVAVDFGTSSTCAVMSRGGEAPQVVLVDGASVVPSAVYAGQDGRLFVGAEAERQAAIDPSRYEPHPKRRIDEGELLLGDRVVPVVEVIRAVLARMVAEARRAAGGAPVDQLVLTHPAGWGAVRPLVLRRAADPLARAVVLIPEPVAAAEEFPVPGGGPDEVLAVLDLGAGTVDASVVRRRPVAAGRVAGGTILSTGGTILSTAGDPAFGGADIDQALLEHVGAIASPADPIAWQALVEGRELADRRRRRVVRADVRTAKETLSRHPYADVPLPPPFPDVQVTRTELERLMGPALARVVALLEAALTEAGHGPGQQPPAGVLLVGGSSRIPMVARLVHERLGIVPRTSETPETVVARGALRYEPARGVAGAHPARHERRDVPGRALPVEPAAHSPRAHLARVHLARVHLARVHLARVHLARARPPRARRYRVAAALIGAVVAVGAVAAGVVAGGAGVGSPARTAGDEPSGRQVARYGYSFRLLPGWEQVGGDENRREVRLAPPGTVGPAMVLIQQNRLSYDSGAESVRPRQELRAQLSADSSGRYRDFDPEASFAGRDVIHYRESTVDGSIVDWYVLFQESVQVSIGCRHTAANTGMVERICREVVRTLRIR